MQADNFNSFFETKIKAGHIVCLICFMIMCTSFRRNETGVYDREEIFVCFAYLRDSPKDKSCFVLLEAHVSFFL